MNVASFGTLDIGRAPALREAVEIGLWTGVDLTNHRSTYMASAPIGQIDLLLGFEHAHVRQAVVDIHAPRHRTFMVTEFVDLTRADPDTPSFEGDLVMNARARVERTATRRRADPGRVAKSREIPDPFGRSRKTQIQVASDIRELALLLAATLFGVDQPKGLPPIGRDLAGFRPSLWRRSVRRR